MTRFLAFWLILLAAWTLVIKFIFLPPMGIRLARISIGISGGSSISGLLGRS